VLAVTSPTDGVGMFKLGNTEGQMSTITQKLLTLKVLVSRRSYTGSDFNTLSDRALKDIGFRLDRRDLNSVKPFWLA
jgi:uncharacterized protein YjiS (DUF1127 family)